MLLVDHVVKSSPIHGLGVFTKVDIAEGELIWIVHPAIDIIIPEEMLLQVPEHVQKQIRCRAAFEPLRQHFILSADGDAYMNHSNEANIRDEGDKMYAARFIGAGEELTCDYRSMVLLDALDKENISLCMCGGDKN